MAATVYQGHVSTPQSTVSTSSVSELSHIHRGGISKNSNTYAQKIAALQVRVRYNLMCTVQSRMAHLRYIYTRAKANFFFDLFRSCCRCSINTQIVNNATDRKRRRFHFRFRSGINAPLHCQRWTLIQTRTQIPVLHRNKRRDLSPSLCNVKCSAYYNVTICLGFRIWVGIHIWVRQCKWAITFR